MRWWRMIMVLAGVSTAMLSPAVEQTDGDRNNPEVNETVRAEPVAVVKNVGDPQAVDVAFMDYLYKNQHLDLGENIELTIVYLANCRTETLTGGQVVIGERTSRVTDGRMTHKITACSQPETITTAQARRAGATVVREGDRFRPDGDNDQATTAQGQQASSESYDSGEQEENGTQTRWRIHGLQPFFKWDERAMKPPFKIEVISLSGEPPRLMWHTTTEDSRAHYPDSAPELTIDEPYRVRVTGDGQTSVSATFLSKQKESSSDDPLEKLVPLGR